MVKQALSKPVFEAGTSFYFGFPCNGVKDARELENNLGNLAKEYGFYDASLPSTIGRKWAVSEDIGGCLTSMFLEYNLSKDDVVNLGGSYSSADFQEKAKLMYLELITLIGSNEVLDDKGRPYKMSDIFPKSKEEIKAELAAKTKK